MERGRRVVCSKKIISKIIKNSHNIYMQNSVHIHIYVCTNKPHLNNIDNIYLFDIFLGNN